MSNTWFGKKNWDFLRILELQRFSFCLEFVVDQSLEIEVVHVKLPSGKGHKKKSYVDLEKSLKEKGSFIKIINRDHLANI